MVSVIGRVAGEAVPLQRSQGGQLCLPPLEPPHTHTPFMQTRVVFHMVSWIWVPAGIPN